MNIFDNIYEDPVFEQNRSDTCRICLIAYEAPVGISHVKSILTPDPFVSIVDSGLYINCSDVNRIIAKFNLR